MFEAAQQFRESRVKRLPVVNDGGQLTGIISTDDMTAVLARELFDTCRALEPRLHQALS